MYKSVSLRVCNSARARVCVCVCVCYYLRSVVAMSKSCLIDSGRNSSARSFSFFLIHFFKVVAISRTSNILPWHTHTHRGNWKWIGWESVGNAPLVRPPLHRWQHTAPPIPQSWPYRMAFGRQWFRPDECIMNRKNESNYDGNNDQRWFMLNIYVSIGLAAGSDRDGCMAEWMQAFWLFRTMLFHLEFHSYFLVWCYYRVIHTQ